MPASVATVALVAKSIDQKTIKVYGTIAVGAGNYAAGGLTIDLSQLCVGSGLPLEVRIASQKVGGVSGYVYAYNFGTTQANGLLQVFTGAAAQAALTELANGATPAGVTGDTIAFSAVFLR